MNLASIAWKSIRQRWLSSTLTSFSVALGVALMITVLVINGVVTRMFSQSATGFHLILGAKGSPMQLVLNTLYFMDRPIENLPYKYYLEVKGKSWAGHAIPFALGDTTSDGRYRIVGTIPEYFEVEYVPQKKFQFRAGGPIKDSFDAVIGARVASAYRWTVGQKFPIAHGGNLDDIHDEKFTVAGVLEPTGTPIDRAVFIHFDGFYEIPGHEKSKREAEAQEKAREEGTLLVPQVTASSGEPAVTALPKGKIPDEQKEVTAILVQMSGTPAEAEAKSFLIKPLINKGPVAQAVEPMEQISKLLRDFVGNIRTMLVVMTTLIIVVSGVGIFVSIYNSMSDRKREIAIMRALGANRTTVFSIIVAESILLCLGGAIAGLLIGHGLVFAAAPWVEARSDVLINPWAFETEELYIFPALLALAVFVGIWPGITAYRTDVARGLTD
jgi:putative ABC transport system permease protein